MASVASRRARKFFMPRHIRWSMAALLVLGAAAPSAELNVGDPAPKLAGLEFIKGEPVKSLEKGKVYVIEFWNATVEPDRSFTPCLAKLQKEHRDVTFIAVNEDQNQDEVRSLVERMGDRINYRVALDGRRRSDKTPSPVFSLGRMLVAWAAGDGQNVGSPVFIVNRDGRLAWVGRRADLSWPLERIVAGKWDLAAAAARFRNDRLRREMAAKIEMHQVRVNRARIGFFGFSRLAREEEKKFWEELFDVAPELGLWRVLRFFSLVSWSNCQKEATEYGRQLIDGPLKDDAPNLNLLAWALVAPDRSIKPRGQFVPLALAAAERADKLRKGTDPNVADTLARAAFISGDRAKAIATQERALRAAKGTSLDKDQGMKDRAKEYRTGPVPQLDWTKEEEHPETLFQAIDFEGAADIVSTSCGRAVGVFGRQAARASVDGLISLGQRLWNTLLAALAWAAVGTGAVALVAIAIWRKTMRRDAGTPVAH